MSLVKPTEGLFTNEKTESEQKNVGDWEMMISYSLSLHPPINICREHAASAINWFRITEFENQEQLRTFIHDAGKLRNM